MKLWHKLNNAIQTMGSINAVGLEVEEIVMLNVKRFGYLEDQLIRDPSDSFQ